MICERHRPNFHGHLVSGLISGANSNDHHPKAFESDGLMISCTFLYPEQFDALRRTYDCEKNMVESLSRCVKWNVSGGKSGSAFLKTQGKYLLIIGNVAHPNNYKTIVLLPRSYRSLSCKQWKRLHLHTLIICRQQFMPTLVLVWWSFSLSLTVCQSASYLTCKSFWLLQVDFQENGQGQGTGQIKVDTNEFTCYGELVLRQTFQRGMECSCLATTELKHPADI